MVKSWQQIREQLATPAVRDGWIIATFMICVWAIIERTETCDRFFDWVADNPDYELDSFILAFLLAAVGVSWYALRRYFEVVRANEARELAERDAHRLAYHDPLTGLPNRRALNERLEQAAGATGDRQTALVLFDLDRFKSVNDIHGHGAGDRLLRLVGDRFRAEIGPGQSFYRLGGDEFACVIETSGAEDEAPQRLARRCIQSISEPFESDGLVHHIGASAGIAMFPGDANQTDALMRLADIALYRSKEAGRGQHRFYEAAMDAGIRRRATIEQRMRAALNDDQFKPFYQPIIDLKSGNPIGFELLARWISLDQEEVGPDEFIPIAEESGLINDMMLRLIECARTEARDWDPALTIAINISPVQLKDPWLSQKVLGALAKCGFAPQRLAIEITENAIISDADNAKRTIESFKNQGMRIGLDDFGTGYSSLHHLRILPFDKIKIDRSFVMALGADPEALKIVRAINGLAQSLDLPVVAEGIECAETAKVLRELGCAQGQGYFFGKAMSGASVGAALTNPSASSWGAARSASIDVGIQRTVRGAR